MGITRLITLIVILFTIISAWIIGIRMRRRIKRALGREVTNEVELTSLNTWINVQEGEEKCRGGKTDF